MAADNVRFQIVKIDCEVFTSGAALPGILECARVTVVFHLLGAPELLPTFIFAVVENVINNAYTFSSMLRLHVSSQ